MNNIKKIIEYCLQNNAVINTQTEASFNELIAYLDMNNYFWNSGSSILKGLKYMHLSFSPFICINFNKKNISYGDIKHFSSNGYNIIKIERFGDFF